MKRKICLLSFSPFGFSPTLQPSQHESSAAVNVRILKPQPSPEIFFFGDAPWIILSQSIFLQTYPNNHDQNGMFSISIFASNPIRIHWLVPSIFIEETACSGIAIPRLHNFVQFRFIRELNIHE